MTTENGFISAGQIEKLDEKRYQHPLNPNGVRVTRSLGDAAGLITLGVHLVRLEPGRDSTEFHFHHNEEEFLYVLSGRGIADIGDQREEVGEGDFLGFPAGSPPHSLSNPFDVDLVYLASGARLGFDVCDYPRRGKRLVVFAGQEQWVDL